MSHTKEQRSRILNEISETNRLIAKERKYQEKFQNKEYLASLSKHLAILSKMLEGGAA